MKKDMATERHELTITMKRGNKHVVGSFRNKKLAFDYLNKFGIKLRPRNEKDGQTD
jgi:hypothetical protein